MSNKMSMRDEERMVNTISVVLQDINKGKSPEDAVVDAAVSRKLTPTQTARVCEACNKMSAIQRLSSPDVGCKKATFPWRIQRRSQRDSRIWTRRSMPRSSSARQPPMIYQKPMSR